MKATITICAALLAAMSLAACGHDNDQNGVSGGQSMAANAAGDQRGDTAGSGISADRSGATQHAKNPPAATATLKGTEGNADVSATIRFQAKKNGVAYTTRAQGLTPGKHGYHIHVNGDCSASDASSAGTHLNLRGSSKNPPKDIDRITGNLGNLDADDNGKARDHGVLAGASLTGKKGLIARSVIIHAKPNDPSKPPIGAAGARQACGVIKAAGSRS